MSHIAATATATAGTWGLDAAGRLLPRARSSVKRQREHQGDLREAQRGSTDGKGCTGKDE